MFKRFKIVVDTHKKQKLLLNGYNGILLKIEITESVNRIQF